MTALQSRPLIASLAVAACLMGVPLTLSLLVPELRSYDAARLVQLGLFFVVGALSWHSPAPGLTARAGWGLLALFGLGLLSSAAAANPWMAWRELLTFAALGGLAMALAAHPKVALQYLPRAATLAVFAYSTPVLSLALFGAVQGLPLDASLPLPGFANRRYLNHVQTIALPLAVWGVFAFEARSLRWLGGVGLISGATLLWITLGRGTLLGLGFAIICLSVQWAQGRREARPLALCLAGLMSVAGLLAYLLQRMAAPIAQAAGLARAMPELELTSDHSRFALWQRAWDMALQSPWLGAGPMHYAHGNHEKAAHPHSMPLQLLSEWGLPATLLCLLLLAGLLLALLGRLRRSEGLDYQLGACLLATWAAVIVDSFFSGLWVMPVSQVWLGTLLGLSWAWLQANATPNAVPRRWSSLPLVLSVALLLHSLPELLDLSAHLEELFQQFPSEGVHPRFWSHGHFH